MNQRRTPSTTTNRAAHIAGMLIKRAGTVPSPRLRLLTAHPLADKQVLLVGLDYAPESTGIAPYSTGMAEYLAKHARGVTVLTGTPQRTTGQRPATRRWHLRTTEQIELGSGAGLTINRARHRLPGRQGALTRAGNEAAFTLNALSIRLPQRPHLVIAVTPSLAGAVAGAELARRHGSKLLVVAHDLLNGPGPEPGDQSSLRGGADRAAVALERYALIRADRVAIVNESLRAQVHAHGVAEEKVRLFPNWARVSPATLSRADCRQALGWPAGKFTVVHTGDLGPRHDLGNLIEAARLCRTERRIQFVIVGAGSRRASLEAQASGLTNLMFVDPLDQERYPLALAAADVLVVNERPGAQERTLPSELASYLPAGLPIVAAVAEDGVTAWELRRTDGAAVIIPPGEPTALVEALLVLALDPSRRARMAAAGQAFATAELGEKAAAARLDALIEDCLSGP
jgi:putative colanic acid biosynthesis glycosyltransferase WcaI